MERFNLFISARAKAFKVYFLSAMLITLFLFFINEGYNSFGWMADPFTWIPFFIYVFFMFLFQAMLSLLVPRKLLDSFVPFALVFPGIVLGFWFVAGFWFS